MSKENAIHQQDQTLIEAIHSQHVVRIGMLGDEAIQFQDPLTLWGGSGEKKKRTKHCLPW